MVQVPVQDAGELQLGQFIEFQAQRAAGEIERAGVGDQLRECGAFEGHREAAAQFGDVKLQAMGVGDHGQAGQRAFAGLGLEDGGHEERLGEC